MVDLVKISAFIAWQPSSAARMPGEEGSHARQSSCYNQLQSIE